MNKEHIIQLAKEFCWNEGMNTHTLNINDMAKFLQSMIEKGEVMTFTDHQRYKDEYQAQINTEALCCAVADVEKEHDLTTALLKSNVDQLQELTKLQRKRIQQLESTVSSAGKEVKTELIGKIFRAIPTLQFDGIDSSLKRQVSEEIYDMLIDQFKSSPASTPSPAKAVSDDDIKNSIPSYVQYEFDNCDNKEFFDSHSCERDYVNGAKWMRKQSTGK